MPGSTVTLHFKLALEDGTEAFSTEDDPMTCTLGDGTLLPGLELALYGLKAGDEQTLTLTPEQAWGERNLDLIKEMPRSDFPADDQLEAGQVLAFSLPDGEETTGTLLAMDEDQVLVDFNHPLSGHNVVFYALILGVDNSAIAEDD
ncbi:MAG TPA: peptidylprolyl isomerase [Thiolapillus brandeum]|uniref:Peptidyl-prolyl cis-trans isomerase n=1 Tax=Thiolapillus brandeum TaxID=1076588 RepID=A0A831KCV8_9GAMM|nr:peptidylprolyl isomerase [Thiolapillus brandeum]